VTLSEWVEFVPYLVLGFDPMGQGERTYYPGRDTETGRPAPSIANADDARKSDRINPIEIEAC
jgi:hypothetical protein